MSGPSRKHTAFQALPVVDITSLHSPHLHERQQAADQLGQAARDAGFFYLTGHRVSECSIEALIERAKAYFAQPHEVKMRNYIGESTNHSGYVPEGEERFSENVIDRKEAYDVGFDHESVEGRRPLLGPNRWPEMPGFREDVSAYYKEVLALSKLLFRGFALALGVEEDRLVRHVNQPPSQLRLIHYPFDEVPKGEGQGIGSHTDYECFTILLPTAPGLEVINGAGEWISVPVMPGAFVINIGDMLEVLSNGAFVATRHRVRKVPQERYSFPLFCACDYDTVIEPIVPRAAQDGPSPYTPLNCGDHIYAQTQQTFTYLKQRIARGELKLPEGARTVDSFGRKAEVVL
ncbi:2-oxoglutarate and iron-dependent oxygenase domain-containing protein [Variovorax sp. J22R133]|uniref:isopenicillin N synthase family dioxygenase n=1 Tax=Variovorax brevis TaxID=3053503 RepID=UPI002577D908|nr:2-oxoglutarate and iron-dependent oxygenase domain-containing protein [Variovorax sp. J22R133]MDM0114009.1 2-oxoglutarate and iron-dependent oxygenase domain-containing protein [Variovorax sp. J22R133]